MKTKKGMGNLSWIAILMVTLTMAVTFGCSDDKENKDSEDKTPGVLKPGPLPAPAAPLPTEGGEAVNAPPATPPAVAPAPAAAPAALPAEVAVPAAAPEVEEKEAVVEDQTVTECPVVPVAEAGPEEKKATPKEKGKEREQFPEHEIFNYLTADVDSFVRCDVGKLVVSTLVRQLNDRTDDFKTLHEESDNFLDFFCARHESFGDVLVGLKGIDTSTNDDDKAVVLAQFREPLNAGCDTLKAVMEGQDANFREPLSGQEIKAIAMPAEVAGEAGTRFKITRQDNTEAVLMFGYLPADLKYLFLVPADSGEEARERALEMLDTTISVSQDEESSIKTTPLYDFYQNLRSTAMCDGVGKFQEVLPEYLRLYDSPYIAFKMDSMRARSASEGTRYGLMKVSAALYSDETSGSWSWNVSADIKSEVVERFFAREFASASSPSQPVDVGGRGPGDIQVRPSAEEIAKIQKKIADVEKALKYVGELSSLTVTWTYINTLPEWLGKEITARFKNLSTIKKSDLIKWLQDKLAALTAQLGGTSGGGKSPQPAPAEKINLKDLPPGARPEDAIKLIEKGKVPEKK